MSAPKNTAGRARVAAVIDAPGGRYLSIAEMVRAADVGITLVRTMRAEYGIKGASRRHPTARTAGGAPAVLAAIRHSPGTTAAHVARDLGISRQAVSVSIRRLTRSGIVRCEALSRKLVRLWPADMPSRPMPAAPAKVLWTRQLSRAQVALLARLYRAHAMGSDARVRAILSSPDGQALRDLVMTRESGEEAKR